MARQRRHFKRSFRPVIKRRSFSRSSSSGMSGIIGKVTASILYGASRQWLSEKLQPLTEKVPGGVYADNLVLGGLSYALATGKIPGINKIPMARDIGQSGLIVESALLGVDLKNNIMPGTDTSSSGLNVY